MAYITEEMIKASYEVFFTKDKDVEPVIQLGMDKNSAKMTIVWFEKLFSGELYKRTVSTLQIKWILNKLYQIQDYNRLKNTLESLNKYCDYYSKKPMVSVRHLVKEFERKLSNIA